MSTLKKLYGTHEYLDEVNSRLIQCMKDDQNTNASIYSEKQTDESGTFIEIDFADLRKPWIYLTQAEFDSLVSDEERGQYVR